MIWFFLALLIAGFVLVFVSAEIFYDFDFLGAGLFIVAIVMLCVGLIGALSINDSNNYNDQLARCRAHGGVTVVVTQDAPNLCITSDNRIVTTPWDY